MRRGPALSKAPWRRLAGAAALALLAACGDAPVEVSAPRPAQPDASPRTTAVPPSRTVAPSAASETLSLYYARLESDLLSRGLLRRDSGGPDAPFTDTTLARNFEQIALFDEYVIANGNFRAETTESRLRRWEVPVRFGVEFGAGVPESQRARDRATVERFVRRLARVSGHPMIYDEANANFHVLILTEDDRREITPRLRELVPGITEGSIRAFRTPDRGTLCLVLAFSPGNSSTYTKAVAMIRAEHPDLMREACIHEELTQGLGLANDSPAARPSIFNDDEEFALLTTHDELLLRMLYDPRLTPGMTPAEARPTVRQIASELIGGRS